MLTIAKGSAFQLKLFRLRLLFTQRGRFLIMCCLTCIYIKQTATGRFTSENASDLLQISFYVLHSGEAALTTGY